MEEGSQPVWLDRNAPTLNLIGLGLALWLWLWPWPQWLVLPLVWLAPLVAVGLASLSSGAVSLGFPEKSDVGRRPTLVSLMLFPAAGLAIACWRWFALFYWTSSVWIALAVAAGVALVVAFVVSRADRRDMGDSLMFVFAGLGGFVWAMALIVHINGLGPPRNHAVTPGEIANMWASHGRSGSSYHIVVKTLDGQFQESFSVYEYVYNRYVVGEGACIIRDQGRLGIWWRDFQPCPRPPRPAP